jgi:uncharacterized RDD family membrane protein YckC
MVDEANGAAVGGAPSFPGGTSEGAPPMPPPMPPPPPSYPAPPPGGYPPPQGGYGAGPGLLGGSPYASWGLRVGGYLIDGVIFVVVNFILQALFRRSNVLVLHHVMTQRGVVHHQRYDFLVYGLGAIFFLIYCTVLVGGPRGQTVGMMAVGARAVRDESNAVVGYGRAFWRSLVALLLGYTVIVGLLDVLWPLWDKKNQTLHDKAVGTVVLRTRNAG